MTCLYIVNITLLYEIHILIHIQYDVSLKVIFILVSLFVKGNISLCFYDVCCPAHQKQREHRYVLRVTIYNLYRF